jgi:phosphate transport system substrate-binding protein
MYKRQIALSDCKLSFMQQILFIAGLAFIIFGVYSFFKAKKTVGLFGLTAGILLIASAYLTVYLGNKEKDLTKIEVNIRINGSKTIGQYLMPELVKSFLEKEGYKVNAQEDNSEKYLISASKISGDTNRIINFEIISKGSLSGFEALKNAETELAMSSTQMSVELAAELGLEFEKARNKHVIGYDALRLIVHPSTKDKLPYIRYQDFEKIMLGEIKNWDKLIKNKNGEITICLRDSSSGSFRFIEEKFLSYNIPNNNKTSAKFEQFDYFEKIVKKVSEDPLSIGIIDYGIDSSLLNNIYNLGLIINENDIIFPNDNSISSFKYPLSRPLILYSRGDISKNEILQHFINFCQSEKAAEIVKKMGFVPSP